MTLAQAFTPPSREDRRRFLRMIRNGKLNPTGAAAAKARHRAERVAKRAESKGAGK